MSTEIILTRMMSDPAFAESVFSDAAKALAEYNLSAEDLAKFQKLTRAQFTSMAPEERKSFGIMVDERTGGRPGGGTNHNETLL